MEKNKHEKSHGGNHFLFGLILGGVLATLLTTKKGRQILREVTDLGLSLLEDFIEEKTKPKKTKIEEELLAQEDIVSDITENEEVPPPVSETVNVSNKPLNEAKKDDSDIEMETVFVKEDIVTETESVEEEKEPSSNGNGHSKKRLFKGIRRKA